MKQAELAHAFAELHKKGAPLVLYNIWDAGSAKVLADEGAPAVATGSASVAMAQGFSDGEAIPLDLLYIIVRRISETVDIPLSVDFEGGYAVEPETVGANVSELIAAGAIGLNFEDQIVGGDGLHPIERQVERIKAIRAAGDTAGVPIWINARTDVFLKDRAEADHAGLLAKAVERAAAYAEAGADSFFAPWLREAALIETLAGSTDLPLNIMWREGVLPVSDLASLGVVRVSYGPGPYRVAMADLAERVRALA